MPVISNKSLRRGRILHAAGRLFAYQGYHGTSTRQIAHLANVSELTVFRHFKDKESLFWTTLGEYFAALDMQRNWLAKIGPEESAEAVLPKILELFTETADHRPDLLRLMAVAYIEMHPRGEAFIAEQLSPALSALRRYLDIHIEGGQLRNLDSTTMTAALAMTALAHGEMAPLIDREKPLSSTQERNRAQARFWLDLLAPAMPARE